MLLIRKLFPKRNIVDVFPMMYYSTGTTTTLVGLGGSLINVARTASTNLLNGRATYTVTVPEGWNNVSASDVDVKFAGDSGFVCGTYTYEIQDGIAVRNIAVTGTRGYNSEYSNTTSMALFTGRTPSSGTKTLTLTRQTITSAGVVSQATLATHTLGSSYTVNSGNDCCYNGTGCFYVASYYTGGMSQVYKKLMYNTSEVLDYTGSGRSVTFVSCIGNNLLYKDTGYVYTCGTTSGSATKLISEKVANIPFYDDEASKIIVNDDPGAGVSNSILVYNKSGSLIKTVGNPNSTTGRSMKLLGKYSDKYYVISEIRQGETAATGDKGTTYMLVYDADFTLLNRYPIDDIYIKKNNVDTKVYLSSGAIYPRLSMTGYLSITTGSQGDASMLVRFKCV